jgi:RNA polymerase sigma factor (sigma-70 family)
MGQVLITAAIQTEHDQRLADTVIRERARLWNFIRRRVPEEADAEDILQDVFSELIETYHLMKPVEEATAWLYRVARNKIIDAFRKRRRTLSGSEAGLARNEECEHWEDLLPSHDGGPEARYARNVLLDELEAALAELPAEQRQVFLAHELEGRTFQEISEATGVNINTLLARKRYAVRHLRERLQEIRSEFLSGPGCTCSPAS